MAKLDDVVTWRDLLPILEELGVRDAVLARLRPVEPEPWEAPEMKPLGNMRELLKGGTSGDCDAGQSDPGSGDSMPCA